MHPVNGREKVAWMWPRKWLSEFIGNRQLPAGQIHRSPDHDGVLGRRPACLDRAMTAAHGSLTTCIHLRRRLSSTRPPCIASYAVGLDQIPHSAGLATTTTIGNGTLGNTIHKKYLPLVLGCPHSDSPLSHHHDLLRLLIFSQDSL